MVSTASRKRWHAGTRLPVSLALLSALSTPLLAGDNPCLDIEFAKRCVKTCAPWCKDALFFVDHQDFCLSEAVHNGQAQDAVADCGETTAVEPSELDRCLTEAERNARSIEEKLETLRSQPALMAELRERLKGVPTCAPDSPTLIRMFKCLEEEGSRIESEFAELSKRGYTELTDIQKLCDISRDTMTADFSSAQNLGARATRLQQTFERINACKTDYEAWGEKATEAASKRASGGLFQAWVKQIRADLEPTAVMASSLNNTIVKINQQSTSIIDSVGQAMVICP